GARGRPGARGGGAGGGRPLIAAATGAIPEVVHDGSNGFLVPGGSPSDLRLALRRLVDSPTLRQAMGEASLEVARRDHDAMANHRQIFSLLAEVSQLDARLGVA